MLKDYLTHHFKEFLSLKLREPDLRSTRSQDLFKLTMFLWLSNAELS